MSFDKRASRAVLMPAEHQWPNDVDLWHIPIPTSGRVDTPYLNDEERRRASRYHNEMDRRRFAVTRSALRELLSVCTNMPAAALQFGTLARGRPILIDAEHVSFNVSHSGSAALVAISRSRTVGVDIERDNPRLDWRALTSLVCTVSELGELDAMPHYLQRRAFFRCWTAKEAILKALGLGITEGLQALTTHPGGNGEQQSSDNGDARFRESDSFRHVWLSNVPGYITCLAYRV